MPDKKSPIIRLGVMLALVDLGPINTSPQFEGKTLPIAANPDKDFVIDRGKTFFYVTQHDFTAWHPLLSKAK